MLSMKARAKGAGLAPPAVGWYTRPVSSRKAGERAAPPDGRAGRSPENAFRKERFSPPPLKRNAYRMKPEGFRWNTEYAERWRRMCRALPP